MKNLKRKTVIGACIFLAVFCNNSLAQNFIPLWTEGKIPNTKNLQSNDSIANERYWKVAVPGMFAFFPSKQENTGSAVLICPGGGYDHLAYVVSGTQLAKWYNTLGINAFVLIYRLPVAANLVKKEIAPLQDAQRAIRLIRANAAAWGVNSDGIGVMGISAGGHVASCLGTHGEDVSAVGDSVDQYSFNPNFMILISPVISMKSYVHAGSRRNLLGDEPSANMVADYSTELCVTNQTPPTFIVHAENDKSVKLENSLMFASALREKNVSVSLHVFPSGGHSFGLSNNPGSSNLWKELCELWIEEKGFK
ncbi:MAG: alpha/beta hydrolase [Mangrovibacterium sp.]